MPKYSISEAVVEAWYEWNKLGGDITHFAGSIGVQRQAVHRWLVLGKEVLTKYEEFSDNLDNDDPIIFENLCGGYLANLSDFERLCMQFVIEGNSGEAKRLHKALSVVDDTLSAATPQYLRFEAAKFVLTKQMREKYGDELTIKGKSSDSAVEKLRDEYENLPEFTDTFVIKLKNSL